MPAGAGLAADEPEGPRETNAMASSAKESSEAPRYMENYDQIVHMVNRRNPRHAHQVAVEAFRSDEPLRWALRYLGERKRTSAAQS